jgi:DNA-binding MarR family transcriptional regulator
MQSYAMPDPHCDDSVISLPCFCATLRRVTRVVTQIYDDALRPHQLRVTQFTLLQVIEMLKEITPSQLGQLLGLDNTTLSRSLRSLEASGWIASVLGIDRRARSLRLTAAGSALMRKARPAWQKAQRRLQKQLAQHGAEKLFPLADRALMAISRIAD